MRYLPVLMAAVLAAATAGASADGSRPEVWMAPPGVDNGRCFRDLFEKPDAWKETRSLIDVVMYTDLNLKRHFTDEDLRKWFAQLAEWKLRLAMEVGAIKPWGLTGEKTFSREKPNWERLQGLGANLYAIAMDEPFLCCREHIHKPDDYAVQETASYIALVRKHYPQLLIGDIETFPSIPVADHVWWIDALNKRLAELGVRGLDFYRLDVNWANFIVQDKGSWPDVRKVEQFCRSKKMPFSLIYWASGQPLLKKIGLADESTWYISIMHQGHAYAMAQGKPDQYVIESWIGEPPRCVPETDEWTFTRSARDFCRTFVRPKAPGGAGR
ncbi:MAG TPA: hypothetical protein PLU30_13865 [Verrucomicrobiae bacterium]|nr:hypothetical protein [Verrucomicrobiae bacterium]